MIEPPTRDSDRPNRGFDEPRAKNANSSWLSAPLTVVLLVVSSGVLVAFGLVPRVLQQQSLVEHTRQDLKQVPYVSVLVAKPAPRDQEFSLPGTTQAIQDAPIYARVDGYLHSRFVSIGDKVRAGQTLATIDTPELDHQVQAAVSSVEQAQANLENNRQALSKAEADAKGAAANVRKAKSDLEFFADELQRYEGLSKQGAVSFEDRDTRLREYKSGTASLESFVEAENSARASIKSARAAIHVAEAAMRSAQSQHDQYNATRSFRTVTAPFDGVIVRRGVDAGALISSGSTTGNTLLFEVAKTDVLRAFVYVPEQFIPFVRVGQTASLYFQAYPGQKFVGTVTNISGGVDTDSKTLQVELHVANADHKLLPGMYVQANFQAQSPAGVTVVPATTLQTRAEGTFIYCVDKNNRVHMSKLVIGRDFGGQVEVLQGVLPGDSVIVNPRDDVADGMLVQPVATPVGPTAEEKAKK